MVEAYQDGGVRRLLSDSGTIARLGQTQITWQSRANEYKV
jgi:hypothetical protein